jgi:protein phosphatase
MTKPVKLALGIGLAAVVFARAATATSGLARFACAWVAVSCAIAAFAYAWNRPGLFGKRGGRLSRANVFLLLPYLVAFRVACRLMRDWRRTPALSEVQPGLWVGGRIDASDLPVADPVVLDLVCEFDEPEALRGLPGYRCVPVLDGHHPPDEEAFLAVIDELAASEQPVVVHCESGRGRAPTAAALLLLRRGVVRETSDAIAVVAAGRPWTKITTTDRAFIERMTGRMREPGRPGWE